MTTFRHFIRIMDFHTLAVTLLALLSTWLCRRFGFAGDMPSGLIGVAIVFPIVFSINAAYRRRESALGLLADLKAHTLALYYIHRDWARLTDEAPQEEHRTRFKGLARELFSALNACFRGRGGWEQEEQTRVYQVLSRISGSLEDLRRGGLNPGEISRANQYLRGMVIDFEKMLTILRYRTPLALRAYSRIFSECLPCCFRSLLRLPGGQEPPGPGLRRGHRLFPGPGQPGQHPGRAGEPL